MLTDEQALTFCGCKYCESRGQRIVHGVTEEWIEVDCQGCSGTGIDPAKRTELEELLREAQEAAWSEGYQEGSSDAANYEWGHPSKNSNPYAKALTND